MSQASPFPTSLIHKTTNHLRRQYFYHHFTMRKLRSGRRKSEAHGSHDHYRGLPRPYSPVFPLHRSVLPSSHDTLCLHQTDGLPAGQRLPTFLCLQLQILGHLVTWEGAVRKFIVSRVPSGANAPLQKNLPVALPSRTPPPRSHPAGRAESSTDESGLSHLTPPPFAPQQPSPDHRDPPSLYI